MPSYFRLQDLTEQTATGSQRIEEAIDVSAFKTLTVQTRVPGNSSGTTTLILEHAAVLDEDAFADVATFSVDLTNDSNDVEVVSDTLRYVRWKISAFGTGTAKFMIDIIAREN